MADITVTLDLLKTFFTEEEMLELSRINSPLATTIDEPRVNAAIEISASMIESYLPDNFRRALPGLTEMPVAFKSHLVNIIRYQLAINNPSTDMRDRYLDAIAWLKRVADGLVTPFPMPEGISSTFGGVDFFAASRVFTEASLSNFGKVK